jgi:hypothetical protein
VKLIFDIRTGGKDVDVKLRASRSSEDCVGISVDGEESPGLCIAGLDLAKALINHPRSIGMFRLLVLFAYTAGKLVGTRADKS